MRSRHPTNRSVYRMRWSSERRQIFVLPKNQTNYRVLGESIASRHTYHPWMRLGRFVVQEQMLSTIRIRWQTRSVRMRSGQLQWLIIVEEFAGRCIGHVASDACRHEELIVQIPFFYFGFVVSFRLVIIEWCFLEKLVLRKANKTDKHPESNSSMLSSTLMDCMLRIVVDCCATGGEINHFTASLFQ